MAQINDEENTSKTVAELIDIMKSAQNLLVQLHLDTFEGKKRLIDSCESLISTIKNKIAQLEKSDESSLAKTSKTPSVEARKPKDYIISNTKASNLIFIESDNKKFYEEIQALSLEAPKSKKEITGYISLRYDDSQDSKLKIYGYGDKKLKYLDRIIHDSIVTLSVNGGNIYMSNSMIFHVISGDDEKRTSPEWNRIINKSINRMFQTWMELDVTEQAKAYKTKSRIYKDHILNCAIGEEVKINGQITTCIRLHDVPVLYRYANEYGQVIRIDIQMLNIPDLENTPENVILKHYLLQQISIMEYKPTYSRTMKYDTIYELLGIQAKSESALRKKKKQIRDKVKTCIEHWKTLKPELGLIQDYEENRNGKEIESITFLGESNIKKLSAKKNQ